MSAAAAAAVPDHLQTDTSNLNIDSNTSLRILRLNITVQFWGIIIA